MTTAISHVNQKWTTGKLTKILLWNADNVEEQKNKAGYKKNDTKYCKNMPQNCERQS